jgi:hypothetical protein
MVIARGITLNRVTKPTSKKIEQNTSAKTARPRERPGVNPNIGGNWIRPGEKNIINLGNPWVSIKDAMATLAINKAILVVFAFLFTLINFFIIIILKI